MKHAMIEAASEPAVTGAPDVAPSADELLLAQLAQSLFATRAQAAAVIEQCDASLMVIRALQERERQRAHALAAAREQLHPPKAPPRTFGMSAKAR